MIEHGLLLAAILLGHGCLTILLVNWTHGLGISVRWSDRATLALMLASALIGLGIAWWLWGSPWADWSWPWKLYGGVCLAVALIGLPGATILLRVRHRPTGTTSSVRVVDLASRFGKPALIGPGPRLVAARAGE